VQDHDPIRASDAVIQRLRANHPSLIDLTTGSVSLIPHLLDAEQHYGIHYLAAPVSQGVDNAKLGCIISNSFGFGGTNASVVLKRLDV